MRRKIFYLSALVILNAHSFLTMPPWQSDTWQRLGKMAMRDFSSIEPFSFTVFVFFGMFSMLLAMLILIDGWYQRIPAWPFALSMMVLGPSMVFLYQAFRQDNLQPTGPRSGLETLACSRVLPVIIAAIALGAIWDGRGGDFANLLHLFQTDYITHAMLVDELLFILLTPILVTQDLKRTGRDSSWTWITLLVPLFGACAYLATAHRYPLEKPSSAQSAET